jgi:hypothetical protein
LGDEAKRTVSERFSFARQLNETKAIYNSILDEQK